MFEFIEEYVSEILITIGIIFLKLTGNNDKAEKLKKKLKKQEKKVACDLAKAEKDMQKLEEMKKEI